MLTEEQLKNILLKNGIISDKDDFAKIKKKAEAEKKPIANYIIDSKKISEESLYKGAAEYFEVPFANIKNKDIAKNILNLIPKTTAQENKIVAFEKDDEKIKIATLNPDNLEIIEFIKKKTGLTPEIFLTSPTDFEQVIKQYQKSIDGYSEDKKTGSLKKGESKDGNFSNIKIIDTVLEQAFYDGASDVHIEPEEKEVYIRYRIDGILKNVMALPRNVHIGMVARVKVLANLKVDEHRLPQDGRFKIVYKKNKVSFRVSIIPTLHGEKVVMRLLEENPKVMTLEQLGFQPSSLEIIKNSINKPYGMILITGPTGSGKTSSLYSIINILNTPKVNISTVEDPIEYNIQHVNQSQANPKIGYTFASGLRALLRQDPDIIMVGEIRDNETAKIAVNAAMTGHLVLSTLHTNDALTTIPRLLEMGVPAFLVASTTNVVIAQRLVRKICRDCVSSYHMEQAELNELKKQVDLEKIMEIFRREKIISKDETTFEKLLFYKGKGCPKCNNTGYKGRTGIYEILEITPEIAKLIAKGAEKSELYEEAEKRNMLKIIEDGFIKIKNGITTIEEVLRVTKE